MKTQFASFINRLFAFVYALVSNPQRIRLVVTAVVLFLVLATLLIPSLAIVADNIGGGH